jgi:hypothetical protein
VSTKRPRHCPSGPTFMWGAVDAECHLFANFVSCFFLVRDLESGNVKLLYKVSLGLVDLNT